MFPLFSTHISQMGEKKFNQKTPIFLSKYATVISKNQDQQHRQEGTRSEETRDSLPHGQRAIPREIYL